MLTNFLKKTKKEKNSPFRSEEHVLYRKCIALSTWKKEGMRVLKGRRSNEKKLRRNITNIRDNMVQGNKYRVPGL